jgi:antitoxin component HigA of HigAB toxin-antitoxin module
MNAALTVDRQKYARLANRIVVKAIESEEEFDRMVAAVEALMDKGESNLSTRGRVSEVLNGKRAISKEQAKKLALLFRVSAALFI